MARTLVRRWEEALCNERRIQEEFDRFRRGNPPALSAAELRDYFTTEHRIAYPPELKRPKTRD